MSQNDPTGSPVPPAGSSFPPPAEGGGYPGPYMGPPPDAEARTMGMLCHLLGALFFVLGALIIWLVKRDSSKFVDDQGKESLNFTIMYLILTPLCLIGCVFAPILILLLHLSRIVFQIIATVQANKGVAYRYPFNFRFVK